MKNDNLSRFMRAVDSHGFGHQSIGRMTGYDNLELRVAHSTAINHGFMTMAGGITAKGLSWIKDDVSPPVVHISVGDPDTDFNNIYDARHTTGRGLFELLMSVMPGKMFAAMVEIECRGMGYVVFEQKYDIPSRSAKILLSEGHAMSRNIVRFLA